MTNENLSIRGGSKKVEIKDVKGSVELRMGDTVLVIDNEALKILYELTSQEFKWFTAEELSLLTKLNVEMVKRKISFLISELAKSKYGNLEDVILIQNISADQVMYAINRNYLSKN